MIYTLVHLCKALRSFNPITFLLGACFILLSTGCDLKANLQSLLSISNVPVCEITNPPCELPDGYEEYYISAQKFSGRGSTIASQTLSASTTLIYGDEG